jgi:hypothetical protein
MIEKKIPIQASPWWEKVFSHVFLIFLTFYYHILIVHGSLIVIFPCVHNVPWLESYISSFSLTLLTHT